jgi:molybdate transport system permease protein
VVDVTGNAALPRWIYVPAALGVLFVVLPLIAVVARVNWADFGGLISSDSSLAALGLSVKTAVASTLLCVVLGVPMALVLARGDRRIVAWLRPLVLLPLVLPPVVGGIALLYAFGRMGLLGRYLDAAGIQIAFSTTAVVLAQTFVSLPFLVIALEGAARTAGGRFEVVAATLGARPTTVWRRVSLPLLAPGLASGAVLAFARSLGEFGATLTFAGSREGVTRTLPLEIYLQRESDANAAVALSVLLVAVAAVVVVGLGSRRLKTAGIGG